MRKFLFAAVSILAMTACTNSNAFTIVGTVENANDGDKVLLQERVNRELVVLDSTYIENGKFAFKGEQVNPKYVYVTCEVDGKTSSSSEVILEAGNITVDINTPVKGEPNHNYAKGTALNDAYTLFQEKRWELYQKEMEVYNEYKNNENLSDEERAALEEQLDAIDAEITEFCFNATKENIGNFLGTDILLPQNQHSFEFAQLQELANAVPEAVKSNERVATFLERVESIAQTQPGCDFKEIEQPSPEGTPVKLSEIVAANKYTMIDFWASWCGPCRAEMPNVVAAYAKYHAKGFEIAGCSLDNDGDKWKEAIKELGMTWPQMSDLKGWQNEGAKSYTVNAIPATVLISQDGKIIARNLRGAQLEEKLAELFAE